MRGRRGTGAGGLVLAVLVGVLAATPPAAADPPPAEQAAELARDFADPLTTVPQLFLQDVYSPQTFGTAAQANRVVLRLLVPRLPGFQLLPFHQLVRPSFSLVTVPTGRGRGTRTAFGDMQLFDLAVLPWPGLESGLVVGVGPTFTFPTATHRDAGERAWQVGPAFGAIYKSVPGLLGPALRPLRDPAASAAARLVDHAGQGEPGDPGGREPGVLPDHRRRHDHHDGVGGRASWS
jgi:hypothetical protein